MKADKGKLGQVAKLDPEREQFDAAGRLASARGEDIASILNRFTPKELMRCPRRFSKRLRDLQQAELVSTGVRDGLAYAELPDGHVFYSRISQKRHKREYHYIADTIPSCVTEETYLAAIDVVQRYLMDVVWPPEWLLDSHRGNVIELGAYLGHKTIRFAEEATGYSGKVLAVEMIPGNAEILRRNVEANGLEHKVDVAEAGVWDSNGTVEIYSKGRQRNAIAPIENLQDGQRIQVETRTLDSIIESWGVGPIDLVFMTVNGAEVECLRGFAGGTRSVRAFYIMASYEREEGANVDICRSILEEKGYRISKVKRRTPILVATQDSRYQ